MLHANQISLYVLVVDELSLSNATASSRVTPDLPKNPIYWAPFASILGKLNLLYQLMF